MVDDLAGRASQDGRLIVHNPDLDAFAGLSRSVEMNGLRFNRVHSVGDDELAELSRRAAVNTGEAQPDLAGMVQVIVPAAGRERMIALAQELHALKEVEYAELESLDRRPPPPAEDIAPVTPLLVDQQTYRNAANGVDVDHLWEMYGVRGNAGLRLTDCEYLYNATHEDLSGLVNLQTNVVSMYTAFGADHGTSVLGILASGRNGYGTTGSVPECPMWFYPEASILTTGSQSRAACVTAAIAHSSNGDIVILEMQTNGPSAGDSDYVPAEYTLSVWNAVKTGSNAGIITVAAAGNGNQNLNDATLFSAYANRGDSGAIIVGAGDAQRSKLSFSSYGSRVNVQGWGTGVFTTGGGSFASYGGDVNQRYTASFSGTSSATPVVASAAALLQSAAIQLFGFRLSPSQMRSLLVNTGRAQTGASAATTPIGPLPNLKEAMNALWMQDQDSDGSPNWTEDPDGDSYPNLLEYVFGMNPLSQSSADAALAPKVSAGPVIDGNSTLVLEFNQPAARSVVSWFVQSSASLLPDSWQDLVPDQEGVSVIRIGDMIRVTAPAGERKFLRVRAGLN